MKKLNVEIKRMDEDVVATSTVCSHPDSTIHTRIVALDAENNGSFDPGTELFEIEFYMNGSTTLTSTVPFYAIAFEAYENAEVGGWYYYDEDLLENGYLFGKCEGSHSNFTSD